MSYVVTMMSVPLCVIKVFPHQQGFSGDFQAQAHGVLPVIGVLFRTRRTRLRLGFFHGFMRIFSGFRIDTLGYVCTYNRHCYMVVSWL